MGMKEWFFFDRVTLHSRDITPRSVELATVIEANLTDSGLSLGNWTAVTAGIAANTIAIQFFPKSGVGLADVLIYRQNIAQRGHEHILRLRECVRLELKVVRKRQGKDAVLVRLGLCLLAVNADPFFGLLASRRNLGPSHLGGKPFKSRFAVVVASGEGDHGPHVGFR